MSVDLCSPKLGSKAVGGAVDRMEQDTKESRISYAALYIVQVKKYSMDTPNMATDSMEHDTGKQNICMILFIRGHFFHWRVIVSIITIMFILFKVTLV